MLQKSYPDGGLFENPCSVILRIELVHRTERRYYVSDSNHDFINYPSDRLSRRKNNKL